MKQKNAQRQLTMFVLFVILFGSLPVGTFGQELQYLGTVVPAVVAGEPTELARFAHVEMADFGMFGSVSKDQDERIVDERIVIEIVVWDGDSVDTRLLPRVLTGFRTIEAMATNGSDPGAILVSDLVPVPEAEPAIAATLAVEPSVGRLILTVGVSSYATGLPLVYMPVIGVRL